VPLCLGIALASSVPLFAGFIAGIIGGIVVGFTSRLSLGVSGQGNGLTILVLTTIAALNGSWPAFLTTVVLAGICLLIILKKFPHALGYYKDVEGDFPSYKKMARPRWGR
jgi:MFS superfamily sulfate permease-like transporter